MNNYLHIKSIQATGRSAAALRGRLLGPRLISGVRALII